MLKQKTINGAKWTAYSTILITLLQLIQISILARFLDATAFGLMAVVMVIIGFSQVFLDMGISNAIIFKQEITHEQLSTLYWVNIIAGFLLFLIMYILAPFIAVFYAEPELKPLILLLSSSFLIQPFGQQFMVLWQKEMNFLKISKINILNKFIALIVSVWFAYYGSGIYALAYGMLAGITIQTIMFVSLGLKEYKPSYYFKIKDIKEFINFGLYQIGDKTINYFNYQIDTILIGKLLGMEALGLYNIAKQLIMKPDQILNPIITKVTFPAMARMQNDTLKLKKIYLKIINYLSSVIFPIYIFIFIFADILVNIMFGDKWFEAVPIIKILSVWGALRSTGSPIGALLMAKGKASWGFWWNLGLLFFTLLGLYLGSFGGLMGISWALIILSFPFGMIANWYYLVKPLCGATFIEYHIQILKSAIIALCTWLIIYISIFPIESSIAKILVGLLLGLFSIFGLNFVWNKELINELRGMKF